MNITQIKKYLLALVLIVPLLIAISFVQKQINTIKKEDKLTDTTVVKNAPPVVAFVTIVLGSFRGLLADILWLRSTALQEEGKYYEMVQLASWMTKLQPRFTGAAAHLAWNMAYNISVTCSSHEDRWRWVNKGIELLRDEALVYNPADPVLYKELGWIYQHKIGNIMDDANQYYKNRMALDLMEVFGKADADWEALASAPKTEKELKELLKLDDQFWKAMGDPVDKKENNYKSFADVEQDFKLFGRIPKKVQEKFNDQKSIEILDNYFRAKWLKEKYKLDPKTIIEINSKYGNLDWRLPEAHAIYWATKGIENDRKGEVNVHCDRMITQSIKDSFMGGKLAVVDRNNPQTFSTMPNLDVADSAIETYKKAFKRQDSKSFHDGMRNFMKDIIVVMYTFGRYSEAQKFYNKLRKENPTNLYYRRTPLDEFVIKEWKEDVRDATPRQATSIITGLINRSLYMAAAGNQDAASGHLKLAQSIHRIYQQEHDTTQGRVGLESFDKLKKAQIDHFRAIMGKKPKNEIFSLPDDNQKLNKDQPEKTAIPKKSKKKEPKKGGHDGHGH